MLTQRRYIKYYSRGTFIALLYLLLTALTIITGPFYNKIFFVSYIDEIVVLLLAIYSLSNLSIYKKKEIIITSIILLSYLVYSLLMRVNKPVATIFDFILFLKPFISFYVVCQLRFLISKNLKKTLKWISLLLGVYCWVISPFISVIYSNTAAFYPSCILCAISYLFFSDKNKKDWVIALCMLTPGLLSIRAKFYTEYIFFIFIAFALKKVIHFNLKYIIIFSILASISIYISWEKFSHYFIYGNEGEVARTALYVKSLKVVKDYMPFGPGYGTYGTEAAAKYYSPLYHKYKLDYVWGLRDIDYGGSGHDFLKDAFYPVLAQFGIIGVILYIVFWWKRWKESLSMKRDFYKLFLFVFIVMSIQNIASNSFTGTIGVELMMMLGLLQNQNKMFLQNSSNSNYGQ